MGIYLKDEINSSLKRVSDRLRSLKDVAVSVVETRNGVTVHTQMQSMFNVHHAEQIDAAIHELIMIHAVQAERLGPRGFDACIEKLLEGIDDLRRSGNGGTFDRHLKGNVSEQQATPPSMSDVNWLIDSHASGVDAATREMLSTAISMAGFKGNIIVERAASIKQSVEAIRGYGFKLTPMIPIIAYVEKPRILCVDGYVESVSEIHHVLESASSMNEPVVVFVRGMGDDVVNTMKVNYDRGSLRVIPVMVKFDFDGLNTLADICTVTGADLVCAGKGDLISAIDLSSAPIVDRVSVMHDRIVIHEDRTHEAVSAQISRLRAKRAEATHETVEHLYDERLRSLTPNHVVIRLHDGVNYVQNAQAIDYTLRALRSLIGYGTITIDGRKMLSATHAASNIHAKKCLETLMSIGAATINRQSVS